MRSLTAILFVALTVGLFPGRGNAQGDASDQVFMIASKLSRQTTEMADIVSSLEQHAKRTSVAEDKLAILLAGSRILTIALVFGLEADLLGGSQLLRHGEKPKYFKHRIEQMTRTRGVIRILSQDLPTLRDTLKASDVKQLISQALPRVESGLDLLDLGAVTLSATAAP